MAAQFNQAGPAIRRFLRRFSIVLILLGLVAFAGYYFYRTYTISDGTRTGLLFKISRKGVFFKTGEGQLHLGGSMQMSEQSIWNFSTRNQQVYEKLQQYEGKNVKCHYHEVVNAFPWQGDTNYIVDDVDPVQ